MTKFILNLIFFVGLYVVITNFSWNVLFLFIAAITLWKVGKEIKLFLFPQRNSPLETFETGMRVLGSLPDPINENIAKKN